MSYVYLAVDNSSKETGSDQGPFAQASGDTSSVERLRREAGLAMRLEHPNVCRIIRLGETEDGLIYLVMPYLPGELLSDREVRDGPLPLDLGIPLMLQMCRGLQHAHDCTSSTGISSRKTSCWCPMPMSPGGIRAVVMDFGLAKERRAEPEIAKLTATGIVLGTPEFMSPEQIRGKALDAPERCLRARHPRLRTVHRPASLPGAERAGDDDCPAAREAEGAPRRPV